LPLKSLLYGYSFVLVVINEDLRNNGTLKKDSKTPLKELIIIQEGKRQITSVHEGKRPKVYHM
jgi:hypothetical protein